MLESALVGAGKAVITKAAAVWLSDRSASRRRHTSLSALVQRRVTDTFARRTLERQLEAIADEVAQRLAPLCEHEFRQLAEGEKAAALDAVVRTFEAADLSDAGLFAVDADPATFTAQLERVAVPVLAGAALGEAGSEFFHLALADCARCFLGIVAALPPFDARASVEVLRRLSALDGGISEMLDRLPRPTLDAPAGIALDHDFRRRYLDQVGGALDVLEMPGLTTRRYRPRTTLTVAYLSLTVTARDTVGDRGRRAGGRLDRLPWLPAADLPGSAQRDREGALRVEAALAGSARMLIRGAPGSGKTTLLQWLAVTAARNAFHTELRGWNGCVPFLVRLREHAEGRLPAPEGLPALVTPVVAGLMPAGWAHRVLASGRAVLLVDGVDEVAESRRAAVREWLRGLLREFPSARVVVTSRPGAAGRDWLRDLGFSAATVEHMTPPDVRAFVGRWHRAAADAALGAEALPCPPGELAQYERRLLAQLDHEPHLRALAVNPLLCALLCALNLDRGSRLPRDRIELYDAALDMLLERRDAERDIHLAPELALDARSKSTLLRALAWWLAEEGRSELPAHRARELLRATIGTMPTVSAAPEAVLRHLVERSGVIREPALGRVDFVHRTFQEYLAAQEAADRGHSRLLVDRAHLDQWRETIVMAAGHGDTDFRNELLDGLHQRAEREPRHARQLRLLAVCCLETMPTVDSERQARVAAGLDRLLPPRRTVEARSLATAGPRLLRQLPTTLGDLSPAAAAATVRTAALIHGPEALDVLARYGTDPRAEVQRELIRAWQYFDPEEYAQRVLADSPLQNGSLTLTTRAVLPGVRHLRHLTDLSLDLEDDQITDLAWLHGVPHLHNLHLDPSGLDSLDGLAEHGGLRELWVSTDQMLRIEQVQEAPELASLKLWAPRLQGNLNVLRRLPNLSEVRLGHLPDGTDFDALTSIPEIRQLYLGRASVPMSVLRHLPRLTELGLRSPPVELTPSAVAQMWPELTVLDLRECPRINELEALAALPLKDLWLSGAALRGIASLATIRGLQVLGLIDSPEVDSIDALRAHQALEFLYLQNVAVSDLRPLVGTPQLRTLWLRDCTEIADLGPLARLPRLQRVDLLGARPGLDLTPLAGKKITIHLYEGQEVRGLDALGRRVRIEWRTPLPGYGPASE